MKNKRLLVVDDEESIRLLYHDEFEEVGYQVELSADAEDALEKIKLNRPDLIILDIKMKGMDGITFLRKLRQTERNLPVVMSTAYGEFKQNFGVWASDAYVTKSSDLTELINTVNQILT